MRTPKSLAALFAWLVFLSAEAGATNKIAHPADALRQAEGLFIHLLSRDQVTFVAEYDTDAGQAACLSASVSMLLENGLGLSASVSGFVQLAKVTVDPALLLEGESALESRALSRSCFGRACVGFSRPAIVRQSGSRPGFRKIDARIGEARRSQLRNRG